MVPAAMPPASTETRDRAVDPLPRVAGPPPASADTPPAIPVAIPETDAPAMSIPRQLLACAHTQLGGVLFLINALARDGVWQRFADADDAPDAVQRIGGWRWVAIVARRLLGPRVDIADDPIWAALADLDGEEVAIGESATAVCSIGWLRQRHRCSTHSSRTCISGC